MAMNSPPAYGHEEALGIQKEVTYGTAIVTDMAWLRPTSFGVTRKEEPLPMAGPSGASVPFLYSATLPRHFRGIPDISGSIVCEMEYEDFGWVFQNAVGTFSTGGPTDTSVYTHTATVPAVNTLLPNGLTLVRITGLEDLQYAGCMVDNLEISGKANEIISWSADFICQSGGAAEVDDTISTLSTAPWAEFHHSAFRYGAVTTATGSLTTQVAGAEVPDWTWRIENGLRAEGAAGVGGRMIREPNYSGQRKITTTMTRDYLDDTWFDHIFPSTEPGSYAAVAIKCTADDDIPGGSSTAFSLDLYTGAGIVMGDPTEYGGGVDILPESIRVEAAYDGSNAPFTGILVNGATAY